MVRIDVVTLFPELIQANAQAGVVGRAQQRGLLDVRCWNPRDDALDVHRSVDDRPYGGGPGMVMTAPVLAETLTRIRDEVPTARTIYLSPQGERLTQDKVAQLAGMENLVLLCGRYEGIDERLVDEAVDEEISIGDYVLSGGELAASVLIDAIGRLQEGALNAAQSAQQDSFSDGLLDYPHYTRPETYKAVGIPAVLGSGDHAAVRRWRHKQALGRTWLRRPDLLARLSLDDKSRTLLQEFRREHAAAHAPAGTSGTKRKP